MTQLQVIFMDAGQGDSTLILFPDETVWLVDCGSIKNGKVVGNEIVTVLQRELPKRNNRIDRLILTHPDQDHYNLLQSIAHVPINEIVYGGTIDQYTNKLDKDYTYTLLKKMDKKAISPDKILDWRPETIGGAEVHFLAANASGGRDTNNDSIVLMIDYKTYKFLLMGDAEKAVEDFILSKWDAAKLTSDFGVALKLGHHGSDTSSSEPWVKAVKPTAAVVSADTRAFGKYDRAMPSSTKIKNVILWSGRIKDVEQHSYVVWCDDCPKDSNFFEKPMQVGPASVAICTSLYELKYTSDKFVEFGSTGGTWYFTMADNGLTVQLTR